MKGIGLMKNNYPKKGNKTCLFKRSLAFILSCAIAAPLLVPESNQNHEEKTIHAAENITYGDVNSDGKISILDIIALKSYILEKNTDGFSVKAADLDGDGTVSAKDAVELSMFLLNQTGSFSCEMNIDTDGDGLCDYIEKEILGTDYLKKDTDGDGLDDYSEVYLCDTDPLNTDTGMTGVKDSAKDADGDKLTNAEEITLGTSPALADTDEDGLSDYDEVKKYKTNPLKEDTDGDGISDNGEIKLGLDPLKVKSDGKTSDAERTFEQKLSSDSDMLKIVNNEDSPYQLSISAKSSGYINEAVSVDISAYSNYLQNDAVTGEIVDIDYEDSFKIESFTISFTVSENAENYYIFRYFDDVNMLLPVETNYDANRIYTDCTEDGTYCIVDMDMWISNSSGAKEIQSAYTLYNAAYVSSANKTKMLDDIEVYFIMYITGTRVSSAQTALSKASETLINYCNKYSKTIKLYYVAYTGDLIVNERTKLNYLDNKSTTSDIDYMVKNSVYLTDTSNVDKRYCSLHKVISNSVLKISEEHSDCSKICFVVDYNFAPSCGQDQAVVKTMKANGTYFSFIYPNNNKNRDIYYFLSSDMDEVNWKDDFSDIVVDKVIGDKSSLDIMGYNYQSGLFGNVSLNAEITYDWYLAAMGKLTEAEIKKIGLPDSDGDGRYDFEEINMTYIKFDENGNIIIPTFEELYAEVLKKHKNGEISSKYWKSFKSCYQARTLYDENIGNVPILVLYSNPDYSDSDGDGIPDLNDKRPTKADRTYIDDKLLKDSNIFDSDYVKSSNVTVEGYGVLNSNTGDKSNNFINYKRVSNDKNKSVSSFLIYPQTNSDYQLNVNLDKNSICNVTIYTTSGILNKSRNYINLNPSESTQGSKNTYQYNFALLENKWYYIDISIESDNIDSGLYNVNIEQDNWIYSEYGGITYFAENDRIDIYQNYGLSHTWWDSYEKFYYPQEFFTSTVYPNNKPVNWKNDELWTDSFNTALVTQTGLAFMDNDIERVLGVKTGIADTYSDLSSMLTDVGFMLLLGGEEIPFIVGALVTSAGETTTFMSNILSDKERNQFVSSLTSACREISNRKSEYNLSLEKLSGKYHGLVNWDCDKSNLEWKYWNGKYINKYFIYTNPGEIIEHAYRLKYEPFKELYVNKPNS